MANVAVYVAYVCIALGAFIAFNGIRIARNRIRPKIFLPEKTILTVVAPPSEDAMRRALGRMRMVFGIVIIVIGAWTLMI